ncbi:SDR family NAD(P)-dependent oxidoreductase, partial [Azoarcus indigens]|nr:SDR family NAD(P)-dependent oxidoreductase [Azoarcus indigens]
MANLARYGSLEGRRVFVTGGGSGIGEAIVAALAEQGAVVGFVDIVKDASEALVARIAASGRRAPLFRYCDITDIAALQAAMADMAAELGDFDVVVNNAANDQRHSIGDVSV